MVNVRHVDNGLYCWEFPKSVLGAALGRRTTVIRLASGGLVIHSTAPFSSSDVAAIAALGRPGWLVEASRSHDTFAREGRAAFPEIPYLIPGGRDGAWPVPAEALLPAPGEWEGELEVLELEGMPALREHLFFHSPSRTLIAGDLVFNFGTNAARWTRWFFRGLPGIRRYPGVSRLFKLMIRDRTAFNQSLRRMMAWDFDRLIPAHGEVVERAAKPLLQRALADAGLAGDV